MGVPVSRGQLAKTVAKASEALAAPYEEMARRLPDEPRINVDETGHKDPERIAKQGAETPAPARPLAWWTWAFRARLFTLFKIVDSRGSNVLIDTPGREFEGVLGSGCFPAYLKHMRGFNAILQLCLAHLIREVKFLAEHPDAAVAAYGARFLAALKALFDVIHRREEMTARGFRRGPEKAKRGVLKAATRRVPAHRDAGVLAKRMREHGEAYFTFVTTPGVEPTLRQPGGAGHQVRGGRPPDHAGDARRTGSEVVRARMDGRGDLGPAGAVALPLPRRRGARPPRRLPRTLAPAPTPVNGYP